MKQPRVSDETLDHYIRQDVTNADGVRVMQHVSADLIAEDLADAREEITRLRGVLQEIYANGWCACVNVARAALEARP